MKKRFLAVFLALSLCLGLVAVPALAEGGDDDFDIVDGVLYGYNGIDANVVIPSNVTSIYEGAFKENRSIVSVTIPAGITSIPEDMFWMCPNLTTVTLPNTVTSIGVRAFCSCPNLTTVNIPNGVTQIAPSTFADCTNLTSITLPGTLKTIGTNAFNESGLTSIVIPEGVTEIGDSAFQFCHQLVSVSLPSTLSRVEQNAFYDCSSLTGVAIPGNITYMDNGMFMHCTSLANVTISSRINIPSNMFYNCSSLTDLVIPEGVSKIGRSAFYGCSNLTNVVIPSSVSTVEKYAFDGISDLQNVYYTGSRWSTISNGQWALTNATLRTSAPCASHSYDEGEVTKQPTCAAEGVKVFSCTACGWARTEAVPQLTTHTPGEAVSNNNGTHTTTCTACHQTVATSDCAYNDGVVTTQPTCSAEGVKTFTCSVCGGTQTEVVAKLDHTYDAGVVTTEPTCAAEGVKTFTCSVCGETKTEPIAKLDHTYDAGVVTTPPTSTTTGVKTYTCTVCHTTKTETIPATGGGSSGGGGGGSASKPPVEPEPDKTEPETPPAPETPKFIDVPETAFYAAPVGWAVEKGITNGTGTDTFSPNVSCTRKEIVTFLWRAANAPEPKATNNSFADVETGSYYDKAVRWALENEVTQGTGADVFSPDMSCTRWQVVTFLWRAAGKPAAQYDGRFTDVPTDSAYAEAVAWAVEQGITTGNSAATFNPDGVCSRGEIVTFLYRAYNEK